SSISRIRRAETPRSFARRAPAACAPSTGSRSWCSKPSHRSRSGWGGRACASPRRRCGRRRSRDAPSLPHRRRITWPGAGRPPRRRPADLTGAMQFGHRGLRNSPERASARETAMRVGLAAAARRLLDAFDGRIGSWVTSIGSARARDVSGLEGVEDAQALALKADASPVRCIDREAEETFREQIEEARTRRDTVGGTFEVRVTGLVPGLGSYTQADLRLDGLLARALASIPAIKAVELGDGWRAAELFGSQVHDPMGRAGAGITRDTNHAGGLEGGVTNGEPLVARAAMKPIATVPAALRS